MVSLGKSCLSFKYATNVFADSHQLVCCFLVCFLFYSYLSSGFVFLNRVTKDFWLFYGISTELFQCGSELKSKIPVSIPWRFTAKVNIKEKKFELDFPILKEEFEVASIRFFF